MSGSLFEFRPIAALYVTKSGPYFGMEGVDPWDETRDARLYAGPDPVVAHPPCQRWCRFAKGIEKTHGYKVGDDGGCFEAALHAVRTYGGVLEHPAGSLAWDAFDLPKPTSSAGWTFSAFDIGASCYVEQGRYGHPMRKATWLYVFSTELFGLRWGASTTSNSVSSSGATGPTRPNATAIGRESMECTRGRHLSSGMP